MRNQSCSAQLQWAENVMMRMDENGKFHPVFYRWYEPPVQPSYQMAAKICWLFGSATIYELEREEKGDVQHILCYFFSESGKRNRA